jgi:hypothetical protein
MSDFSPEYGDSMLHQSTGIQPKDYRKQNPIRLPSILASSWKPQNPTYNTSFRKNMKWVTERTYVRLKFCATYLGQIHFLCSPKRSLCLLVHLPYILILDGKDYKSSRVLSQ